ncbi:MAG: hypothetical protein U5L11_06125 [Arhodomonas sp.]|nr:hypothetical protein [Arhodomonas sp.]
MGDGIPHLALSDDPVVSGQVRLRGGRVDAPVARYRDLSADQDVIAVWADADRAPCGGDVEGWLAALQAFEADWAVPATEAVARGHRRAVCVYPGGDWGFRLDRHARLRFWRRAGAIRRWLQ